MAASAADLRSILALPTASGSAGPPQPKKYTRKPEGISRELYSLIGPSAPSIAAQLAKPKLAAKPHLGGGGSSGATEWELRAFKNSARSDGLQLKHWVQKSSDADEEYPYAKYNVTGTSFTYTQDEYIKHLADDHWTKEETDYLFKIVKEYDSRWFVIYDRYDYPDGPERSIDDLKDRYYSVCRRIIRHLPYAGDEASKGALLQSYSFDKEREVTRKRYVASLENRTPEQIAEEEALFIEIQRLQQNERRFKRERDDLMRTLLGMESGLPEMINLVDDDGPLGPGGETKRRRRGGEMDTPVASTPSISFSGNGPPKRASSAKSQAYDIQHCIVRSEQPAQSGLITKAAHQPVYMRSFKLPYPKAAIAPKVTQALTEIGISHARLVMPTRDNIAALESLIDAASALVETKKLVDKVDADIRVARIRLGKEVSEAPEGSAHAGPSKDQSMPPRTPMEVDGSTAGDADAEGEPDDERAQSVISVRSTRSRKTRRRSVSTSSVDTTATVSTRAGVKRQKRS